MKNINVLIKPASNKCNLNCKYCFYDDVSSNRKISDYDFMSLETSHAIIDNVFTNKDLENIHFGFQGGEPTLAGIDFFIDFFDYVKSKQTNEHIDFGFQTNGIMINEQWCELFKKNNVLVGLSLDGPAKIHNYNRIDFGENQTHSKVMNAVKLFRKYEVEFNVLTVVTNKNAQNIEKVYNYLVKNDFLYLQFIPCLDPLDFKVRNIRQLNETYYNFIDQLFKLWFADFNQGKYVSVRFIDNVISMVQGYEPEACDMRGVCSIQNIIEADGTTFTCDFYALDKYIIGNATKDSFKQMRNSAVAKDFEISSRKYPEECLKCDFQKLCRNGCQRMRVNNKYMYCDALKKFYRKNINALQSIANKTT